MVYCFLMLQAAYDKVSPSLVLSNMIKHVFLLFKPYLVGSWNIGIPKSSIFMGFSIINQPIFGNPHLGWQIPHIRDVFPVVTTKLLRGLWGDPYAIPWLGSGLKRLEFLKTRRSMVVWKHWYVVWNWLKLYDDQDVWHCRMSCWTQIMPPDPFCLAVSAEELEDCIACPSIQR